MTVLLTNTIDDDKTTSLTGLLGSVDFQLSRKKMTDLSDHTSQCCGCDGYCSTNDCGKECQPDCGCVSDYDCKCHEDNSCSCDGW